MAFKDMNHFQHMEDPEERKPEELKRAKQGRLKHESKGGGTVSARTYVNSTRLVVGVVWLVIGGLLSYGVYWLVQAFIGS